MHYPAARVWRYLKRLQTIMGIASNGARLAYYFRHIFE